MEAPACVHHWILKMESTNNVYPAECKLCKATTTFPSATTAMSIFPSNTERKQASKEANWMARVGTGKSGKVSSHPPRD